ncbi:MAG: DUF2341 domain-containing protein [Bacteroidota bacterium]
MKKSVLFLLAFVATGSFLLAQGCAPGWDFYRSITVDNTAGATLTDYQVEFSLNTADLVSQGKLQADGADLRVFADDCTPLPFWGDSLGTSTDTRIWVKIPSFATGTSLNLQVYYGNSEAENATDGDNTFIFFDDFSSDDVDTDKWEAVGEFATFRNNFGVMQYASTSMNPGPRFKFARTKMSFSEQVIFDFVIERSNADGFGFSSADDPIERFIIRDSGFGFDTLNQMAIMRDTISNGSATQLDYPILRFDRSAFNTVSVTAQTTAQDEFMFNRFANESIGDENLDTFIVNNINMSGFHFIVSSFAPSFVIETDNVRVRQHAETPPVSTVGMEEMTDPNNVTQLLAPSAVQVFPNPAQSYLNIRVDWEETMTLQLRDAQGRMIPNINTTLAPGAQHTLSTAQLPAGIYFLELRQASDGVLLHSRRVSIIR